MGDFSPRPLRNSTPDRGLFVDRETEIAAVADVASQGGNVLLVGPPRMGKSSVLHRVQSQLEERGFPALWLEGRLAVSTHDLFVQLLGALATAGQLPGVRQPAIAPSMRLPLSGGELLDDLAAVREAASAGGQTVALLDEPPSEVARTLFGRLRDELWELPITWVVTSADRAGLTAPPADAFWTRIVVLSPLDDASAADLIRKRLGDETVDDELVAKIVAEGEGNPGRLVALGHDVFVDGRDADDTIAERRRRDDAAALLGSAAQRLLADLERNGPASASDRTLLQRLQWSRGRAAQVLKQLEGAGLVTASDRRGPTGRPQRIYEVARR